MGTKKQGTHAAWFAGFVPADHPQYAFAAVYEGEVGSKVHGGTAAAPMVADVQGRLQRSDGCWPFPAPRPREEPEIRRAEPVEEQDESD